jgi:hypothetical protein
MRRSPAPLSLQGSSLFIPRVECLNFDISITVELISEPGERIQAFCGNLAPLSREKGASGQ